MIADGWQPADAEVIVEKCRKKPARDRGVVTRDDVVTI